jgi:hypothetical protein
VYACNVQSLAAVMRNVYITAENDSNERCVVLSVETETVAQTSGDAQCREVKHSFTDSTGVKRGAEGVSDSGDQ